MESKAKLAGHPMHPMLIVFPLGLFITAVIFDIIYKVNGNATLAPVAYWNIAGGVIGGLLAAVFGLVDWLAIPTGTRAKAIGLWHGVGNLVVVVLFALAWLLRRDDPNHLSGAVRFALSLVALVLGTGWAASWWIGSASA